MAIVNVTELIASFLVTGGECPLVELEAFERLLGVRFPYDYRSFLLSCNGGRRYELDIDANFTPPFCFFGFGFPPRDPEEESEDDPWALVELNLDLYRGRIPTDTITFADDIFGNLFLIGIRGDATGRVYFWDHEEEHLNNGKLLLFWNRWNGLVNGAKNVALLADSFSTFVGMLKLEHEQ